MDQAAYCGCCGITNAELRLSDRTVVYRDPAGCGLCEPCWDALVAIPEDSPISWEPTLVGTEEN